MSAKISPLLPPAPQPTEPSTVTPATLPNKLPTSPENSPPAPWRLPVIFTGPRSPLSTIAPLTSPAPLLSAPPTVTPATLPAPKIDPHQAHPDPTTPPPIFTGPR